MPSPTAQPQVNDLLAGLTRTTDPEVPSKVPVAHMLRPVWSLWLFACLVLVVALCCGIMLLGWTALRLVKEIRTRETALALVVQVPLPSGEMLLDADRFRAVVAAHPEEAVRFGCARATALAAAGSHAAAVATWREADQWSAVGLPVAERLALAEILYQQGRFAEAEAQVQRAPLSSVPTEESMWAVDLLGRLQLVRLRSSTGAGQR